MKKFLFIFLIFLLIPSVLAVEFNLNQNFSQGETIIAKISGNFLTPITNENIFFYDEHVRIPMDYSVSKIGEDYYLYALTTGKSAGNNYSVSIQNIQYMKGSEVTKDNLVANFSITDNVADFSINPGFVYSSGDFFLEVQNLQDKELDLIVNTKTNDSGSRDIFISPDSKYSSISLKSGETKKINFNVGAGNPAFSTIELKTSNLVYQIPIYIFSSGGISKEAFEIDPPTLIISLPSNVETKKTIYFYNSGDKELKNISLSLSDSLSSSMNLSTYKIESLSPKTGVQIDLFFLSKTEKTVEGILKAKSENASTTSFISLTFIRNYTAPKVNASILTKTCSELSGNVCASDEKCDKDPIYAKDNVCCLGTCKKISTSLSGPIIGIILLVLIIAVFIFFYKKYKKTKRPVNLLEIAKGKPKN